MLKVNVGLSRKLSHDFNSTGFSVNIEGEVCVPLDQHERVIEKIQEYYDLAEETLRDQMDRHQSDTAIASRDEEPRKPSRMTYDRKPSPARNGNGNGNGQRTDSASTKQINYLLEIGRRQQFTTTQLESEVATILGRPVGLYELTKRDAGAVIDALKSGSKA